MNFASDLALERREVRPGAPGIGYKKEDGGIGTWERVTVTTSAGAESIGRPTGCYDTLTLPPLAELSPGEIEDAKDQVARELCALFEHNRVSPGRILVVGLGNAGLTPDAVGPETAARVHATMQISRRDPGFFAGLECSEIAVLIPGVCDVTGIESAETVLGICEQIEPDAVICIGSLASRSPERLGRTIQFSDTGIFPGSGTGSCALPIDQRITGVPVFAIGMPTVINSRVFVEDFATRVGVSVPKEEKNAKPLFVSPRDIFSMVKSASEIIAGGIDQAFGVFF